MENQSDKSRDADLPACATEFIRRVLRRMWYRRRAKRDVQAELTAHFEDAVRDCATAEEKQRRARELIEEFGDAKLLARLCHRAKKRCRPLWLKALVRSGQGLGLLLLYGLVCMAPTLVGRPTIRVNYAQWLSDHWRPEAPGTENAKVYYDKAVSAYIAPPARLEPMVWARGWTRSDYSDSQVQSMEAWLASNQATFEALRRGAHTRDYWPVYDVNAAAPMETSLITDEMETLKQWRHLTFALKRQILWEARLGKVTEAFDDCLVLRRMGRHLQNKGSLNGQLVGISIENICYEGMVALAAGPNVPPAALEHVQKELTAGFDLHRQVTSLDGEQALWFDRIQRTFTDDGQGGGHALSEGFVYAPGDWTDNLLNTLRFRYPDRRAAVAMVERFFPQAQRRLNTPPDATAEAQPNGEDPVSSLSQFFALLTPAYERVALQGWRLKTHESGVITLLAIQRYSWEKGSYPDSLDQLVKQGFLKTPPQDPLGRGALTYRKTEKGFLLYSWGTNRQDDGGRWGTDSQGRPRMWADNGDWVFWPIPEL